MNRDGLIALSDGVRAYFEANGISAQVGKVGRRERAMQINQGPGGANRVLFFPQPKGARGAVRRGNQTSTNPPVLLELDHVVIVSVWAADVSDLNDEEKQRSAAFDLLELTLQAIRRAVDPITGTAIGFASLATPMDLTEVDDQPESYFGCELQLRFALKMPFYDVPQDTTTPQFAVNRDPAT